MTVCDEAVLCQKGAERKDTLSRLARNAASISARKSLLNIEGFEKDDNGAPKPSGNLFWSISHKPGRVAGVVSTHRIGIDIETIKPVSKRLFNRIVHPDEKGLFYQQDWDIVFFRVFTAKEAVLKHTGDGIKGLAKVRINRVADNSNLDVNYLNKNYKVENFMGDGYLASVTKKAGGVHWNEIQIP